ncbi:unnamed protein product [Meganyctiphanes norvegica]|uniref:Uncharacterized protein n=1 Tax=Meganyctiphanes norvegica TaxID=48144 RepID=A0AAV2R9M3_MEGNR
MNSHTCVVSQCCCGCTLRTGSLIIGVLSLIGDGYNSVTTGLQASAEGWWLLWVTEVIVVVHLIASILLLIGISNNNVKFIKAYVYANVAVIVYDVILVIVLFAMMGSYADGDYAGVFVVMAVTYLLSFLLMIYYTVVIRSYALQVEEGSHAPITGMA